MHECCFVSYLFPRDVFSREQDGVPLVTKYEFLRTKMYEVASAAAVLFCAPLVTPPPFGEPGRPERASTACSTTTSTRIFERWHPFGMVRVRLMWLYKLTDYSYI